MEFEHPDYLTVLSAIREIQEGSTQVTEPHDEQTCRYVKILDSILTLLNDTEKASGVSSATPSPKNSTNQVPEYVTKYTEITSEEQRGRYKADFKAEYEEYKALHSTIESVSKRFTDLEDCLRNAPEGSEQWNHVKQQIEREYEESKRDLRYQQARRKFQYLHDKLAHIKRLLKDYDSRSHNLAKY
ncbi:hypothetical protein MTO96_014498 [Rhipicephalus appendiculatus]